jgi:hypothetical protein
MSTISAFDPIANTTDFDERQRRAWSEFIEHATDVNIGRVGGTKGPNQSQYFNPIRVARTPKAVEAAIDWNAFPRVIERKLGAGTEAAFRAAEPDTLPITFNRLHKRDTRFRPQDEYLEWRVDRDGEGNIVRVTFTCEPPEYWEAMAHGYPLLYNGPRSEGEIDGRQKVLTLYRQLVGPEVREEDLFPGGVYDPFNKWNTSHGIVHLTHPSNTLGAEINLAVEATVLRKRPDGTPITDEQELIICSGYGAKERNSDPSIGGDVNGHARAHAFLTLRNPVGLYIQDLKPEGWTRPGPNNTRVKTETEFWTVVRGDGPAQMGLRAVYEIPQGTLRPDGKQMTVSDIRIAGAPIRFGGQIARFISVCLYAVVDRVGESKKRLYLCEEDPAKDGGFGLLEEAADVGLAFIQPTADSEERMGRAPDADAE